MFGDKINIIKLVIFLCININWVENIMRRLNDIFLVKIFKEFFLEFDIYLE